MAHVAIVGAGPGGAVLAYLLAHRGVDVTLLERQRDFAREFRGEILAPVGEHTVHDVGLGAALEEVPTWTFDNVKFLYRRRAVVDVDLDPDPA